MKAFFFTVCVVKVFLALARKKNSFLSPRVAGEFVKTRFEINSRDLFCWIIINKILLQSFPSRRQLNVTIQLMLLITRFLINRGRKKLVCFYLQLYCCCFFFKNCFAWFNSSFPGNCLIDGTIYKHVLLLENFNHFNYFCRCLRRGEREMERKTLH